MILIQQLFTKDDGDRVAEHLRAGGDAIVNTACCDWEVAQRAIDFIAGVVEAEQGSFLRTSDSVFVFCGPKTILSGELK